MLAYHPAPQARVCGRYGSLLKLGLSQLRAAGKALGTCSPSFRLSQVPWIAAAPMKEQVPRCAHLSPLFPWCGEDLALFSLPPEAWAGEVGFGQEEGLVNSHLWSHIMREESAERLCGPWRRGQQESPGEGAHRPCVEVSVGVGGYPHLHKGAKMNFSHRSRKTDFYQGKLVRVLVKSFVKAHLVVKIKSLSSTS